MEAFAERAPFNGEFRVLAATGKYRWQLAKGTPRFHQDGTFAGYISSCTDFTEIKEIQDLLKESEQRFKNVANNAPVLIWMAATDKQYYFFNLAWLKFTGHTLKQEKGQGWRQGIHADDIERCRTICDAAFDRREEFSIEYRLKRNDGQFRWLSDHATPRFTSEGVFEGYIGACMDIHDRIVSQKIVKENEERLNIVIEASELVTWELNLKTKAVQYSERYLTMLGHPKEKYLTHDQILKHLHPEDHHKREKAFRLAYQTGILHYESRLIWDDKSIHWMEVRGKLFYDERQKPEKAMGTIRDITAEKSHESEIMEREQKFRLLADSMPQHIWTADPQGNLNYFNQSVFNYSGLTPEELQRVGWLDIVHPDDREENMIKWTQAIAAGTDFLLEHRFRRYDGSYRWQLSRAIPQKGDDGQIQRWVGTSTDIQDQKMFANELENQVQQRTNELEQKNAELEKMNKELESFAYISSHDLQEPLRKIQTFSTRIVEKEYATLSETAKDNFQRMQVAAKRMQTLIEDLLAYSRTTVTERKYDNTDLQQIIEEVKEDLSEEIEQKKAIIKIGQKCYTGIIPFQMRQLLQNLMSNSLKFSVEGRQAVITINCEIKLGSQLHNAKLTPEKSYCHISVADNGIGFEPQYSEKIFEVFQRLHGRGDYLGTGIGLAIVKKIAENHQGTITANGSANAGATFDMYFPSDLAKNAKQTKTAKTTNN